MFSTRVSPIPRAASEASQALLPLSLFLSLIVFLALAPAPALAQTTLKWDIESSRPSIKELEILQGETIILSPRILDYGVPRNLTNCYALLYFQEPNQRNAWYTNSVNSITLGADTGRVACTWGPTLDIGEDRYNFFIAVVNSNTAAVTYRAYGRFRMTSAPNFSPASITPALVLDGFTNLVRIVAYDYANAASSNTAGTVATNVAGAVATNVAGLVATNLTGIIATNVAGAVATNVATALAGTIATNAAGAFATNIASSIATNVAGTVATDVAGPVATNVAGTVATNVVRTIAGLVSTNVAGSVATNVVWTIAGLVSTNVAGTVTTNVVTTATVRELGLSVGPEEHRADDRSHGQHREADTEKLRRRGAFGP